MTLTEYLENHWGLLLLLLGMSILLRSDTHLERRMIYRISLTNAMLFLFSVVCYIETWLGNRTQYTVLRPILSAIAYGLMSFILVCIITIMFPGQKKILLIPAILNTVLCFISIPTHIIFYISNDNHFGGGPLRYLPYCVAAFYLIYLFFCLFRRRRFEKEDFILLLFMVITSLLCFLMPLYWNNIADHWFNITISINMLLYYVFLLQQFTKRDPLTNLLNRQSYYRDEEKYNDSITAVVTMDMNGLKKLNDGHGHLAGDAALKALADCFLRAAKNGQRVYRIGGDEYTILCIATEEKEVIQLVQRIRDEVAKTEYTCAIGYALRFEGSTLDRLYQIADEMLYEEKQEFYIQSGQTRHKC